MNPILLQKQLKENVSDLQDFCKDLKSWGEDMKRKEESSKCNQEKTYPKNKIRRTVPKEKHTFKKPERVIAKSGSTDYAAWDKFDADAECEKLDSDKSEDSELTDEFDESLRDEALVAKEKGNKYVKNQKWDEAIACYTKAIDCYSYDPIFYANRALCYLKKGLHDKAETDCTLSLKLDDTYVKAYQRRAAARESLHKFEEAMLDLTKVLELEPHNKESQLSLTQLRKRLGKFDKPPDDEHQRPVSKFTASRNKSKMVTQRTSSTKNANIQMKLTKNEVKQSDIDTSKPGMSWQQDENILLVKPINKPPHLRSKKPLKRIEIIDVDTSKIESIVIPKAFKNLIVERQEQSISNSSHTAVPLPQPNQVTTCIKSDDFKVIERRPIECTSQVQSVDKNLKNISNYSLSTENISSGTVAPNEDSCSTVPKTSVQFYSTWKNLITSTEKYQYLKAIKPQEIPHLFKESLESSVFSNILEVLAKHCGDSNDSVVAILENFTEIKRFATITMFMTSSDKNCLWKLIDHIKENENQNKEAVDNLIRKYEL